MTDAMAERVAPPATVGLMDHPPLGVLEVADLLDVENRTVHQWLRRDRLPEKDGPIVNGLGTWKRETIIRWAGSTPPGRLPESLTDEYRALTGEDPLPRRGERREETPAPAPAKKAPAKKAPAKKAPAKKAPAKKAAPAKRPAKKAAAKNGDAAHRAKVPVPSNGRRSDDVTPRPKASASKR